MREVIIETDAMIRFDSAVDEVAGADRMLSGFVLAYGQAGRGKSVAADRYHYQRGGAYVRVWQGWSQTAFLQRLLFATAARSLWCSFWRPNPSPSLSTRPTACASTVSKTCGTSMR